MEEAVLADELGSNRVKDARAREDAYLEQAVRETDEASKAKSLQVPARIEIAQDGRRSVEPETPIGPAAPATNTSGGMNWEDALDENSFHDIANDDSEMYDAIDSTPLDADGMADQVMAVVQKHVSEVLSQPRVTKLASKFGLTPGFAYDLVSNDENGNPWDFDKPDQRAMCPKHAMEQKPTFSHWITNVHSI